MGAAKRAGFSHAPMIELTCQDLEDAGLWATARCCKSCHGEKHDDDDEDCDDDEFTFEVGPPGRERAFRLHLCCISADAFVITDEALDRLSQIKPVRRYA